MRASMFVLFLAACSTGGSDPIGSPDGGTSSSSGGSSSGSTGTVPAQAIAQFNGGAAAGCATVPAFKVGDFADATAHRPVKDGDTEAGQTVHVDCRVAPDADKFELTVVITMGTSSVNLEGSLDAQGGTTSGKLLLKGNGAEWTATSCKLDATGVQMGVAAGRYWAMVSCAGATSANADTCDIFGQLRVENCAQQ